MFLLRSRAAALAAGAMLALAAPAVPAGAQYTAPEWTRGATCYEIFVRSFQDADGDGIGDFAGLTSRLDYLNDGNPATTKDLGVRCLWLMPVMESPSYHGYDQSDYYRVERDYGTNADFRRFVAEAHRRGIKVLIDLVLNHSSDQHPFFQAALRDTASPYRSWYRFASPKPAERGPWGQDVWVKSPVRDEYYYAVFYRTQPDLNYENPAVREEMKKVARFWLDSMHVDGFRLDAIQYVMEDHGQLFGSPGTHAYLREFQEYVRSVKPDAWTVGEVSAKDSIVMTYYPDQLDAQFAFELADSLVAGVRAGRLRGVFESAARYEGALPSWRWSPFLRNHDQPRTRSEMGGDLRKARLASFLLLTMPGVPFVYYGEEIGMVGPKPDERIRTPMQWGPGRGVGFTRGTPWERLADDSATTTVAAQAGDPRSILALHRRLIHLRDASDALAVGELVPLAAADSAVAAYLRRDGDDVVLVVANLSNRPIGGARLESALGALRPGRWRARMLFGAGSPAALDVGSDGRIAGWVPLPTLAPLEGYLVALTPAPVPARRAR